MSLDPSKYSTLALTHVQYDSTDPIAKVLSLITLTPIFLLCSYLTIILYRRELAFINALLGQLSCEALNWALKRFFRQPRPTDFLGSGYGMPSSHSQFLGFFSSFFLLHFFIHAPTLNTSNLISILRRLEHTVGMIAIVVLTISVCYSRYHLSYHTPAQILTGLGIGLLYGVIYYYLTEILTRRLSVSNAPAFAQQKQKVDSTDQVNPRSRLKQRSSISKRQSSSTLTDASSQKRPAVPIRQLILDHPLAIAFRIRDSWMVWRDGGVEGEYGIWRKEWESRRKTSLEMLDREHDYEVEDLLSTLRSRSRPSKEQQQNRSFRTDVMKLALMEADRCVPSVSAFSVGCIISLDTGKGTERPLSAGFSRELEGNTHAEQCALIKLISNLNLVRCSSAFPPDRTTDQTLHLNLYTTMEPCSERLSGQAPCVERILKFNDDGYLVRISDLHDHFATSNRSRLGEGVVSRIKIKRVFQGVKEPEDFVLCKGTRLLQENGIQVEQVVPFEEDEDDDNGGDGKEAKKNWLELECLRIAKKGHQDEPEEVDGNEKRWKEFGR